MDIYGLPGGSGDGVGATIKNYCGQVRVSYSALTIADNFVANVNRPFPLATGVPTVSGAPNTAWPYGSGTQYSPDFYDVATGRLRENNLPGQQHEWRIIGSFSGKASANNGALTIEFFNPDSGFSVASELTLAGGMTSGPWSATVLAIADSASLAPGRGYQIRARTSFADNNFSCSITNILRLSRAVENVSIPESP